MPKEVFGIARSPARGMARAFTVLLPIVWLCACGEGPESGMAAASTETVQEAVEDRSVGLIYIPAYTYAVDPSGRIPLATTLMIHNVSSSEITIHSVRYYDAGGVLVESQLDSPRRLRALETLEFHQESSPSSAGSGANFLVGWTGPGGAAPLVEALMVGHQGAGRLTFTSRGIEVGSQKAARGEDRDAASETSP